MDDSDPKRGMPVLTDPWMKAHTPTTDATPTKERSKRRSWFCGQGTPVKSASDATKRLEEHREEEVPTLQITHFTKKVMLSFDDVRLGSTKELILRLENPHDFPQDVELEKFPFQKGFSLPETVWEIEGNQSIDVPVSWTPSDEKNVRELVTFKCEGAFRLQLIILGTVKVPKKKKNVNRRSTFTARKGQAVQTRRSVAVTNSRRETFVQKKSPRSQPYPDVGKENKMTVVGKKADTPGTKKARARSVGTVLERILTPRKTLPQGETERVMVGDKVCTFSPQLTAKAMMEITGESPFADGKMQTEPRKETLVLCDGMSPLLKSTGNQDLRKAALEKEAGPLRRLSKEQTLTVTKSSSPASRLDDDENGLQPHHLAFLMPDEAEISKIMATPASSVFEPLADTVGARLSSTRIDDSVNPASAPFFLTDYDQPQSSMEDDSLEEVKQTNEVFDDVEKVQKDKTELPDDVRDIDKEDGIQMSEPSKQNGEEFVCKDTQPEECTESFDVALDTECEPLQSMEPSGTADDPEEYVKSDEIHEPSAEKEPCVILEEKDENLVPSPVPNSTQKGQSWRISLGGGSKASTPPKGDAIVQKPRSKQEGASWRVSLGSSKRSPGARPAAPKRPISRPSSRATTSAPSSKPAPSVEAKEDFTIHKSTVTGRLNRKRLSDPISDMAEPKKSRPSPEHKKPAKETLRSKNVSIDKSGTSLSSSRQFNRTVALRKAAATGKAVPAKAPASSKPKAKPKAPRAVKGVPMAKLQLIKPTRSALPRHPLPFAAKNIFYDERWMEKQDRAFTCWLNYVLTPDIDTPKDPNKNVKIDAHLLCLEGASKVGPAPSREDISLRAYTARRRLNRLRRGACIVFQSEPVIRVMMKVEAEVEKGRIVIREDKMLHADLGIKQELLNLILCYNPLWLRIGLETIYGELLPIQDNSDVYGMSRFVVTRLLGNPDIAAVHAHPTVPNLFGPGYQAALAQFTLKKFLMLVFFLDRAKLTRLIDHDPCLFCKDAQVKSSRDLLLEFSRRYLKGEGDITRHLSFLGYSVTHVQRPLDEFDFAVNKLSVDLRCGVRLARVVELLTQNWTLSKELRVPAISRLQKVHNVEVAFKMLKDRGIDVEGGGLNERVIVDGHREKTLELLWRIIFHYQVGVMLNEEQIREEIAFLTKHRKLKEKMSALKGLNQGPSQPNLDGPHLYFKSPQLMLLMDWCKAVCSFYDMQIENFTVSFCDGRALCLLIHHYHPSLLPYDRINQNTTLMQFQREEREDDLNASCDEAFNGTWSQTFSPSTGKETDQEKLLANERQNFKLLYEKVNELGGVPMMVRSADMSNTIPDEKVVITYVSYLCARLLDLRQETRAARTIQLAWRAHHLRKEEKMRMVREKAASKIQSAMRSFLLKRREERIGGAVLKIQTAVRGFLARQTARRLRREAAIRKQVQAATLIQAAARGFLVRRAISWQHRAATVIQSALRGHLIRTRVARMQRAALTIQGWYRSQQETRNARKRYVELKMASVRVQAIWRGILVRRLVEKMKAAITIQAVWRGFYVRLLYQKQRAAAIILQSHFRRHRAMEHFRKLRGAVIKMQALYRSKVKGEVQRAKYCALRDAAIVMQKVYRGRLVRRDVLRIRSAVKIQAAFRGCIQRAVYMRLRNSAVLIQAHVKGVQARRRFAMLRQATIVLQTRYRAVLNGREVCREYNIRRGAAIIIQSAVRSYQQRQRFLKIKHSIVCLQSAVRRYLCLRNYRQLSQAAVVVQKRYRAVLLGRQVCRGYNITRGAAITIQSAIRCYKERQRFLKTRHRIVILQSAVRGHLALKKYRKLRQAAILVQKRYRAVLLGREVCRGYNIKRGAAITIQSAVRCYQERQRFIQTKSRIVLLQSAVRRYLALKNYRELCQAARVMQTRYRAVLLGRRLRREYCIAKGAAITLQAIWKGNLVRREFLRMKSAAIKLQSAFRCHFARQRYIKLQEASIILQRRFRAALQTKQAVLDFCIARGAIITLQAAFRGYLQKKDYRRTRAAVINLQASTRCYLVRKEFCEKKSATIVLQKHCRALVAGRKQQANYRCLRTAAITLQANYRCHVQRNWYLKQRSSAISIQAELRKVLARKRYLQLRDAAIILQTRYRARVLMQQLTQDYNMKRSSAIRLQSVYRGHLQRKNFLHQKSSAVVIQARVRGYLQHRRYMRVQWAVRTLQERCRAWMTGRTCAEEYYLARGRIITIQALYRGYTARKILKAQNKAATTIQASFRSYAARKRYTSIKHAVRVLETRFRALILAREAREAFLKTKAGVIAMQSLYRGFAVRKELAQQHQAATVIQSSYRCFIERSRYLQLQKAALVLQTRYRSLQLGRAVCEEFNIKRGAAITIQAAYRGYCQRQVFSRQRQSAIVIQAAVKAHQERRSYVSLRNAAVVVQKHFRALLLSKRINMEYNIMRGAAITLQAAYRGHLQRKSLARQHLAATRIQSKFRGYMTKRWYSSVCRAAVVLQTRYRANKLAQAVQNEYHITRGAAITLQAAYRGHLQRKYLALQHYSATKIQALFRGFVARQNYLKMGHAAKVLQKHFRALKLSRKAQQEYHIMVGAIVTIQAAFRGLVARRKLCIQHQMATRIQACFRGYFQRIRYQKISNAALVLQRRFRAVLLGQRIREHYILCQSSAIKIQTFYRCHRERKAYTTKKQSAVKIQAVVRGFLGFTHAKRCRQERTIAAMAIQRRWRANGLRNQQVRCYNIQRGAAITIQAAARTFLVRQTIKKQHRAATSIQSFYRCHRAVQSYRKTLNAVHVLQDHLRAHLLAKKVQEDYVCLRKAATTVQAFYRGHCIRRRIAMEHVAATTIESAVRQFIARKRYLNLKKAAIVLQRRFRATKSCQEETLKYHITRGACITVQAAVRGFLVRKALKKSNRAATVIQSVYRSFRQQQKYNQERMMIILLQTRIRAYLAGKKVRQEYDDLKSATLVVQSMYRGLMARRLAAKHRAARCIQSTFRMHRSRQMYLKQRNVAVRIQALCRMYLAKKSYKKVYSAVCILQKRTRGYLEMRKVWRHYKQKKNSAIIIQSHLRRCIAERRYHKHRQAAICIQSYYRRMVQRRRYKTIRDAVLVIQRRYRATTLMQKTQQEYHMARGAAMTIQAVFRGYVQCCRYRNLRYLVIKMQARARGAMARRCFADMVREKEAAVCIQRHFRGYQTRKLLEAQRQSRLRAVQAFAERTKAHLSVIRLQRAFRNFRLRRAFKQKMDAITSIQRWMRAKLQRLRFQKIRAATCILQRATRRYLIKKNVAATRLQSVARVWLAKRRIQKMHSAALKMQALWRGHRIRCSIKSKKVSAARARCQRANQNVTEEKKLCNRTATALDYLLHYKSMHRILETLISLEVVSRLSAICCQRLVEAGAVPVLYTLIRGCNRSVPCMEMIEIIVKIFLNITKHDSTQHAVLDVEDSVTTLVELLQIYREKNGLIFCKTCVILGKLLQEPSQAKIILSYPKTKEKIASLHKLTSRKHAIDERRIKTKSLNASSSFLGTSFNTSSVASASFAAGTPRKRRRVLALAGAEWNIENPMRAIDFLKLMADRV
ncbi:LOW QUALITY PROTEIN: abnormal spindle-like microcephaly-associated protein homolog [Lytechinus variegatus]|uniref:LOW QUALITY PROTEIN: abnormal spindle-like microcephaly-associated protein homolog n=1 Tax=Lytechinus variegatus TaxID=7654 RepID=UPI001BB2BF21|nr:LOW QUALITY PROTEIN: abnormal spindle-like microcephaly-associated protein homolog [Lytechinus variegatus]